MRLAELLTDEPTSSATVDCCGGDLHAPHEPCSSDNRSYHVFDPETDSSPDPLTLRVEMDTSALEDVIRRLTSIVEEANRAAAQLMALTEALEESDPELMVEIPDGTLYWDGTIWTQSGRTVLTNGTYQSSDTLLRN